MNYNKPIPQFSENNNSNYNNVHLKNQSNQSLIKHYDEC